MVENELEELVHDGGPSANSTPMSQPMPYNPMKAASKAVSLERMQKILEKHTGQPFELKPPPSKALPQPTDELKWKRLTDSSIQSSRGQVILKTLDASSPPIDIYIVFSGSSHEGQTAQVLARFRSAQDAKDYCRLLPKARA